jgi:transcriptional repressor NrdR
VAYLRFASVYRSFESLTDFEGEIAILRAEHQLGSPTTETPSETGAAPPYQSP